MRKSIARVAALAILYATAASANAQIADYPTLDRVLFVEDCIRSHPERNRQEMVYKCSCAMDALAEDIPYSQFTESATAANAVTIAGERGNSARGDETRDQAKRFRTSVHKAYKACLISP